MSPYQVIYLLIAHFVSHYLIQVEGTSILRTRHFSWLVLHSIVYSVALFFVMLLGILLFDGWSVISVLEISSLTGLAHFAISFVMTDINTENKEKKKYYLVLIGTGFEQLAYSVALICLFNFLI